MSLIYELGSRTIDSIPFIYVSFDTAEGGCIGHWIQECGFFLPHLKDFQKEQSKPIKILLRERKQYKINILSDFGFTENDIVYSSRMTNNTVVWQENYVLPSEGEYILYLLPFFYIWTSTIENTLFCDYWTRFRRHYADPLEIIEKTIPILYVARSKRENYTTNDRHFENMDAFIELLKKYNVHIMDVDEFTSLQPQFNIVLKSKVIVVEQGSGYSMNSVFIAANSHVIVLNDCWDVTNIITPFYIFSRKIMSERNTTVEVFSKGKHATPFTVDLEEFEKRLQRLQ